MGGAECRRQLQLRRGQWRLPAPGAGRHDGRGGELHRHRRAWCDVDTSLTITLTGTNDAPVAVADTNSGAEDTIITGTVATNDSDVDDGATLTYALNAPVGWVARSVGGSYSFDAGNGAYQHLAQGATTDVVANYTVTDEHGATSTRA